MTEQKATKIYTPVFRVSFPDVFEAKSFQGSAPKFQLTALFPKKLFEPVADTDSPKIKEEKQKILQMRKAAMDCVKEKWGSDEKKKNAIKAKLRANPMYPFRDGDIEKSDLDGYPDHYFAVLSTKRRPGLIDMDYSFITNENKEDFYSGCYAIATINVYAFSTAGNTGVAFGLQNIKKEADGETFSGGSGNALDDFAPPSGHQTQRNGAGEEFDDFLG